MGLFSALNDRSELMRRMMAQLGVDVETAARIALGTQMSKAARSCAFCSHARECRHWLDADAGDEAWRAFCPNAARFESLRRI